MFTPQFSHRFRCGTALAALALGTAATAAPAFGAPVAAAGYHLSVFAAAPAGATAPDDITVSGNNVFVGYGNGVAGDGSYGPNGLTSTVVEYSTNGTVEHTFAGIPGHVEGLAVGPDGLLYTDENEDGNSHLTVINTGAGTMTQYGYPNPSPHGGGFDGLQFINGFLYASGSNPDNGGDVGGNNINSHPVLYRIGLDSNSYPNTVTVQGVVWGNDPAINKATGAALSNPNIFDPDSLDVTPGGNLLLANESGATVTEIMDPNSITGVNGGTTSAMLKTLNLYTLAGGVQTPANTDETGFATSTRGTLLFADVKNNIIYQLTATNGFALNQAFSSDKTNHWLDTLNFNTGLLTPVVTGLGQPAGIGFIPDPTSTLPEPAGFALLAPAIAALLLVRRRNRLSA